jgi:hypothetical protein
VGSGYLTFSYVADGGGAQFYYVPQGAEDTLFGNGVLLKVAMKWSGSVVQLYLNDVLVQSSPYIPAAANWLPTSLFTIGATEYSPFGFNSSDDLIDEFTIIGPQS